MSDQQNIQILTKALVPSTSRPNTMPQLSQQTQSNVKPVTTPISPQQSQTENASQIRTKIPPSPPQLSNTVAGHPGSASQHQNVDGLKNQQSQKKVGAFLKRKFSLI